ncbi:MAG: RNA-directed DNA polymerase [Pedobacter sp.]|nr:MAG: RNA-directed DNA polymerase [Pedobacter sp.]
MNSSQYKNNEYKKLCVILGFKPQVVTAIIENIDNYYKEWIEKKEDKNGNYKTYKDGTIKKRIIRPSLMELKIIQTIIKNKILSKILMPDCVHGGVKKKSNISNAKPHQGKKYIFTTDLQEFYPNITSEQVYQTLVGLGFSTHFSHYLTKLTTYKYELPQGTPTSTHISNLVFLATDLKLIDLCEKNNITYTRYVDDLTFSSAQDFQHLIKDLLEIVQKDGFKISRRKTNYSSNQTITGIEVFLNKIDAPKRIIDLANQEVELKSEPKPFTNYLKNIRITNKKK